MNGITREIAVAHLTEALENTGRYEVTVTEEAAVLDTPALARYDVVVAIADRRSPEDKLTKGQQLALVEFVRSGKGYVSIHGGDNAPADWEAEFKQMLGGVFSKTTSTRSLVLDWPLGKPAA